MSDQAIMIAVQLAALILTAIGLAITGTWQLANMREQLTKAILEHRLELDDDIARHRVTFDGELALFRKEFGDTFSALRQKINDVELDSYKTFVRRESFYEVINGFRSAVDARMDKIEAKLDKVISQRPSS